MCPDCARLSQQLATAQAREQHLIQFLAQARERYAAKIEGWEDGSGVFRRIANALRALEEPE